MEQVLFRLNRIWKTHISIKREREREREIRFISIKVFQGELDFHPPRREAPIFLDWYFEDQFNSSLRTLSEEIGKCVLLM